MRSTTHFERAELIARRQRAAVLTVLAVLAATLLGASPVAIAATGGALATDETATAGPTNGLRLAQAADPLVVQGPVRVAAGAKAALPVTVAPGAAPSGRYVLIYQAPDWLTFSSGEKIGRGVWLLEKSKLPEIEIVLAPDASGQQAITVAAVDTAGAVQWQTPLTIEVAGPAGAAAIETAAAAEPAPPATAQTEQATPAAAAPEPAPPTGATVTWESLLTGKQPPAAAVPAAVARPQVAAPTGNLTDAQKLETAKHLVRECTTCHNLFGSDVGIPVMVGLTVDRFLDTMYLYRTKKRDHQLMQVIAQSLSEEETEALAMYLSRIKPVAASETAAAAGAGTPGAGSPPAGSLGVRPAGQAAAAVAAASQVKFTRKQATDAKTVQRVARWIERGKQMVDAGDIAQGRLLLQRAAEYGDAGAAMMVATSYDPNALPWVSGMGLVAEPLKAHAWYGIAKQLGAGVEADRRLADLPLPR